jgi:signal peptidase II
MTGHKRLRQQSIAIAVGVGVVDQLTKHWALNAYNDGSVTNLLGSLRFKLTYNQGMAFSQGEGIGPVIGILALVVIVFLILSLKRADTALTRVATGLIIGGASGNVIDRAFRGSGWLRGAVIDFIDLQWWPVFNVADMAIVCGAILMVLSLTKQASKDSAIMTEEKHVD